LEGVTLAINVTIWNEHRVERIDVPREQVFPHGLIGTYGTTAEISRAYPSGIHGALAEVFKGDSDFRVRTVTLDDPHQGLPPEVLDDTDVLVWWAHRYHDDVDDALVARVCDRVLGGMGLIVLHSAHLSKVFRRLMGTTCTLKWRTGDEKELLWVIEPTHPIAEGLGEYLVIEHEEMYGERFDIPVPDELVFLGWFEGGELFRSGCCFHRGAGKIFFFQPGHETRPVYYMPEIQRIIRNAANWARPVRPISTPTDNVNHAPPMGPRERGGR
jgi:trehalose utilization protein